MRIIIAGSRGFNDYQSLKQFCDIFVNEGDVILSGTAGGADQLGERYAAEKGLKVERYPANWNKFGKSAGYRRNEEMAKKADCLIAFWDGVSRGTMHMLNLARENHLIIHLYKEVKWI